MKKPLFKNIFFWTLIILCALSVLFFVYSNHERSTNAAVIMPSFSASTPTHSIKNDVEGYALNVPTSWYAEESATDSITVYPDYSPNAQTQPICKIEMSVFPYASSTEVSAWISSRLGADPTIDVEEHSSENISVGNSSGVEWTGTMDGMPTTIVYAFSGSHAYEIAPVGQCDDSLNTFLKNLTIS